MAEKLYYHPESDSLFLGEDWAMAEEAERNEDAALCFEVEQTERPDLWSRACAAGLMIGKGDCNG